MIGFGEIRRGFCRGVIELSGGVISTPLVATVSFGMPLLLPMAIVHALPIISIHILQNFMHSVLLIVFVSLATRTLANAQAHRTRILPILLPNVAGS